MYVVVVFLEAKSGRQDALRRALLQHALASLEREAGCQRYEVCLDPVEASAFLLGEHAGFITGADLLMDGGVTAALRTGELTTP